MNASSTEIKVSDENSNLIAATRPEFHWYFFLKCQQNFLRIFFQHHEFFVHNANILLIKKHTYQIFTNRKHLEDNLQLIYYLVCTKNVNMLESLKLCMRQEILKRHSKPEFCIPLIMN